MADELKILIQAMLDEALSAKNINSQIKKIRLDSIKVGLALDTSAIDKVVDKLKSAQGVKFENFDGAVVSTKKMSAATAEMLKVKKQAVIDINKENLAYTQNANAVKLAALESKASEAADKAQIVQIRLKTTAIKQQQTAEEKLLKIQNQSDLALKRGQAFFTANTKAASKYAAEWQNVQNMFENSKITGLKSDLDNANYALNNLMTTARANGDLGKTLFGGMAQEAEKFLKWTLVTSAVMGTVSSIKKMVGTVKEVDAAIVDLQMATGGAYNETAKLVKGYNALGIELGATTTEVTDAASDWLRQGHSVADTNKLIEASMVLSKVGQLDSASATQYLTSVMKGYSVSVQDVLGIVDKLSAVDLVSATDAGGLAAGIAEVANNARLAGIEMDKLLGYLAVIGETTGQSMSSVGNSLSTIFSRMGNIKLSRLVDPTSGEDLSNVETTLKRLGIALRDTNESFRDFDDVLDDVANSWATYEEVDKRAIAVSMAGKDHMENFLVLMENYGNALGYTEVAMNSSGTAMEKMQMYQDSLEASTKRFQAQFEALSTSVMDSGLIKWGVDTGTGFLSFLTQTTDFLGAIPTLVGAASAALTLLNKDAGKVNMPPHAGLQYNIAA